MDKPTNKHRAHWLQWQNKMLAGIIKAMGYAPHADKDEIDLIVPMYGMPSCVYKKKEEATAALPLPAAGPCPRIQPEKERKHAV